MIEANALETMRLQIKYARGDVEMVAKIHPDMSRFLAMVGHALAAGERLMQENAELRSELGGVIAMGESLRRKNAWLASLNAYLVDRCHGLESAAESDERLYSRVAERSGLRFSALLAWRKLMAHLDTGGCTCVILGKPACDEGVRLRTVADGLTELADRFVSR